MRIIFPWTPYSEALSVAGLQPLYARRHRSTLIFKTIHMSIIFTRNFWPRKSLRHFIRKNWRVRFFPVARNKHHVQYDLLAAINFG